MKTKKVPVIDLSISIVNTSNWIYLKPCLESIYKNIKGITFEILVVDNVSDDGSQEKIRDFFPEVILSINQQRYGFAKNNNINLRKASGRYVMLLNDDTLLLPGSIENGINFLDTNLDVGAIGCKMVNPDGTYQVASARKFRTLYTEILIESGLNRNVLYIDPTLKSPNQNSIEIDYPSEAGMILRREVIDKVGYLDEQFFMYGEGADWFKRIKKAGFKIVYIPTCPIIHFGGETNKRMKIGMYIQYYKSKYLLFQKDNKFTGLLYRLLIIVFFLMKRLYLLLVSSMAQDNQRLKNMELLNYYNALLDFMLRRFKDINYPFPN